MDDTDKILADNLQECLKLAQRNIVMSIGSALLLLLLIIRVPELSASGSDFEVPGLGGVAPGYAVFIFMIAYLVYGTLTASAVHRARNICSAISDPKLVTAVLTYPSIVTNTNWLIRVFPTWIPPILSTASYMVEQGRGATPISIYSLIGLLVFSAPIIVTGFLLWRPLQEMGA